MTSRFGPWPVLVLLLSVLLPAARRAPRPTRRAPRSASGPSPAARGREGVPRGRAARHLADRDRAGAGRPAAALALGDQPRGQGLLVRQPRRGAGLRQGEPRRGPHQLRRRLLPDQLFLARRAIFPRWNRCSTPTPAPTMPRGSCAASMPSAATGRRPRGPTTRRRRTAPASTAPASTASSPASAARR